MTAPRVPRMSPEATEAYTLYIALGAERSSRLVGERLGKSEGLIERWCARYKWKALAAEHDAAVAAETIQREARARIEEAERARRRRLRIADVAEGYGIRALTRLDAAEKIGGHVAVLLLEFADKTARLDLGDPTERTEITGPGGTAPNVVIYIPDNGRDPALQRA